jgi:DNA adenine methylase
VLVSRPVTRETDKADEVRPKPFLKWAGGKARLASTIRGLFPDKIERYIEPFLGGGALFFSLSPKSAILSDSNPELMNCYKAVKENPEELLNWLEKLSALPYNSSTYYKIRGWDTPQNKGLKNAARTIYLNRTAFNGLYRVNRDGKFNTPFGGYKALALPNEKLIRKASEALQGAELFCSDFQEILENRVSENDFVYLDPPYPAVSKYSDFNRYTKNFFREADHRRLAEQVKKLNERNCTFVLSNAEHPLVRELYDHREFKVVKVLAPRYINCKRDRRGNVEELLITNSTEARS